MANWQYLHYDLLVLIVEKIVFIQDLFAFEMVCKSWMEAAKARQYLRPRLPWLLLGKNDHHRKIYDVSKEEIMSKNLYAPPEMARSKCIGLNYGWVLTISFTGDEMNLVNPFLRSRIELPSHESIVAYCRRTGPVHPKWLVQKAALSGNPSESSDYVLMIIDNNQSGLYLGFWRPGDKIWNSIDNSLGLEFSDVTYYKDQFYAIAHGSSVWACDVRERALELITFVNPSPHLSTRSYIVASSDALLVVSLDKPGDFEPLHIYSDSEEDEEDEMELENSEYYCNFRVVEVDRVKNIQGWKQIRSLGDTAIFVGNCTSFVLNHVSESFCGRAKPNHIYFIDDFGEINVDLLNGGGTDMGSYSLEDARVERFNVGQPLNQFSSPFWFTPCF